MVTPCSEIDNVAQLRDARVAVIVNPNNPTGRIVPADELRQLAAVLADRQGLLIVDEAFADLAPAATSIIENLPRATIVLRSFGKTYGLAGLRLGFAVAHAALAERLRAEIGPWPVSGPALAVGTIALSDSKWLEQLRPTLAADGARLDALAGIVRADDRGRHAAVSPAEPPERAAALPTRWEATAFSSAASWSAHSGCASDCLPASTRGCGWSNRCGGRRRELHTKTAGTLGVPAGQVSGGRAS